MLDSPEFWDYQKAQKHQEGNISGILAIPEFPGLQ